MLLRSATAELLTAALLLAQCGVAGMASSDRSPVIDPAVRSALSGGTSRVIVGLRIGPLFTPEGDLPNAAAVAAQRQAIAKAQADLLGRVKETRFAVSHQYDDLPMTALEIGGDALRRLEASGDVVLRVVLDAKRVPQS